MSSFQALYVEFIKWKNTIQIATNAEVLATKLRAKQALFMRLQFEKNWMFVSAEQFKYYDAKHISKIYAMRDKMFMRQKHQINSIVKKARLQILRVVQNKYVHK
jgi:hypothetical protein